MPNRQIREGMRRSEKIANLDDNAFRLFTLLITTVDDYGRYHANLMLIKSQCYPYDTKTVDQVKVALASLAASNLVTEYHAEGKMYLYLNQWTTRVRAKRSKYPDPVGQEHDRHMTDTTARITNNDITNNDNGATSTKFLGFWKEYPRKVAKKKASESWSKCNCDGNYSKIMESLKLYKQSEQWTKDQGKFIPHPATWLNQERWEDEVIINVSAKKDRGF